MVQQNPLTWNIPIVDIKTGGPTPEFMRKWQLQTQINSTITNLADAAAVSKLLDKLGSTTGDVLYRAATGWTVRAPGSNNQVLALSGGLPVWSGLSSLLDTVFGSAQGDILYRDTAAWKVLAPGTSGNFLQTQGAGANPQWAAAGAGFSVSVTASENISAGALVNLFTSSGALKVRNANATDATKPAHGFVLSSVTTGNPVTVYGPGQADTGLTSLTPGTTYYLDVSAGAVNSTAPSTAGNVIQQVGIALSATSLLFNPQVATDQL